MDRVLYATAYPPPRHAGPEIPRPLQLLPHHDVGAAAVSTLVRHNGHGVAKLNGRVAPPVELDVPPRVLSRRQYGRDRKSTRLNSSHVKISYAVFCLK